MGPAKGNPIAIFVTLRTIHERAHAEVPLEKVTEDWPVGTDSDLHVKVLADLFKSGVRKAA